MLPLGLTAAALAAAEAEPDPDSLGAAQRMRAEFAPELAASALSQVALRRRAVAKFGDRAAGMFFTRDGLEQATRPAVAAHHAARFAAAGVDGVVDLGCGIGADALAFLDAGLAVRAVELDPPTAEVARANLLARAPGLVDGVVVGDAEQAAGIDHEAGAEEHEPAAAGGRTYGWFADPARRDRTGRVWNLGGLSPSWDFVLRLLGGSRVAGVKLGPALPHAAIPPGVEAEWVTHRGSTVEAALWAGGGALPGGRRATVLDAPGGPATLVVEDATAEPAMGPIARYVYEPDGAVIRAGGIALLADRIGATLVEPRIAYLSADRLTDTPFARAYEVLEQLPYTTSTLRRWLRDRRVGSLEIKQRGIEEDPAQLRRRLDLRGPAAATFLITRTPHRALVLVVRRVSFV